MFRGRDTIERLLAEYCLCIVCHCLASLMLGEAVKRSEFLDPHELFPLFLVQKRPGNRIMMLTSGVAVHGELIGFFADTVSER